jgi:uncharacterized membrane protein YagU involved in acid resistance
VWKTSPAPLRIGRVKQETKNMKNKRITIISFILLWVFAIIFEINYVIENWVISAISLCALFIDFGIFEYSLIKNEK